MIYGAETWRLTKQLATKLRSAQRAMERRMIGATLRDRKQNICIREQIRVEAITVKIKKKEMDLGSL